MERSFLMKKYTLALVLVALMPFVSASAYEYKQPKSGYYTTPTVKTSTYKRASTSRKTGGYRNVITNNFYYGQPVQSYTPNVAPKNTGYYNANKSAKKSYAAQERKFFLANPFFQPLEGKVGSVTDLSYARNNFNFDMLNGTVYNIDPNSTQLYLGGRVLPMGEINPILSGKAQTGQFAIKEDLSYGLTDTLSLVLMAQYDSTKITFKDWSDPTAGTDSKSDSGLNIFGIGLQNRFVDTNEWIAMFEAFYQHQKDAANTFMGAVKAGYKIDRTTVYGVGRIAYTNLIENDIYGVYVDNNTGDYLMLSYKTDVKNILQIEGGIGAFAVLNKYFTLNGELMYGHYDWHNQLNIKGAIGWQPGDMFALNVYASTSLYDSAKGKVRQYMNYDVDPTIYPKDASLNPVFSDSKLLYTVGDYKIKDYNEWKIGVQAILYF
jgi:predicted nucleic acid-binding protein